MLTREAACFEQEQTEMDNLTANGTSYCPAFEMISNMLCVAVCWPATPVNTTALVDCPASKWWKARNELQLFCQSDGHWSNVSSEQMVANCIDETTIHLIGRVFGTATEEQIQLKEHIVENTKILQIFGYSISLASLIVSLVIFYSFRSLHCPRTRIHKQLFIAYIIWIVLDIVFWVDLTKDVGGFKQGCAPVKQGGTIRNTPILCETSVFLMEYTRFCVFTWNFVEGLYLHRLVTSAVFRKPNYKFYYIVGWVVALFPVTGWAVAMHYTNDEQCWLGYVFSRYYWLIEGPRNILLFINLIFLINIVRVLITKMRESNTADTMQVKKAVKAAMVLVPLLGVINLLFIPDRPDATAQPWVLYLYFYTTSILVTFQGLVCSLIFCFCNGEVQQALKRKWASWRDSRSLYSNRTIEANGRMRSASRSESRCDKLQYIRMTVPSDNNSDNQQQQQQRLQENPTTV